MNKIRALRRAAAVLLLIPFAYLFAALVGSAIPLNPGSRQPTQGVTIYVADNGVHTGVIVPIAHPLHDWRPIVSPAHVANPGDWIEFGWGDRDFYLNTPTWADVSVPTVLRAAVGAGGETLVHVDHWDRPRPGAFVRRLVLTPEQYRRLTERIRGSFASDAPVPIRGYGASDVFYPARGRYSALRTCNSWVARTLAAAGVRIGVWTPFSAMVMAWLPEPPRDQPASS